jgi:F420-non-reducing hydrogenase iron-sulfur subunit
VVRSFGAVIGSRVQASAAVRDQPRGSRNYFSQVLPVPAMTPDVVVYVCCNCIPQGKRLPRQWTQQGAHVMVHEVPCSGKMDAQYLMHAIEGGVRGLCVVACPKGECHLAQGNLRAEVRVQTVQRLLAEIGMEPRRAELVNIAGSEADGRLEALIHGAVDRLVALGESPIHAGN